MQQAHHNEAPKPSNPGTQGVKRDRERPKGSKDKRPHVRSDDLIVNGHHIVRCASTKRFFELLEDSSAFNRYDSQLESKKERLQHAAANIGTVSTDDYDNHDYSYDGPKAEGLESVPTYEAWNKILSASVCLLRQLCWKGILDESCMSENCNLDPGLHYYRYRKH